VTRPNGLASALAALADLAEIRGALPTASDLRRAAASLSALSPSDAARLAQRARRQRLGDEPGISPAIHWRLHEIAGGAEDAALRAALAGIPWLLRRLVELHALTTADALALVRQHGVLTLPDLQATLAAGRLDQTLGAPDAQRLRRAAAALTTEIRPLSLGRASELLGTIAARIQSACPAIEDLVPASDARRVEPLVANVVLVGRAVNPPSAVEAITGISGPDDVLHRGARRAILLLQHVEVDVRVATAEDYGTTLFRATGPASHVAAIEARRPSLRLASAESDVYAHAGLPWIPAELRQGLDEIEAAATGRLPSLIERTDIRGDLHMHSTYSDGRDTLEAMVAGCCALGYEYMAIADHSERAGAARTVTLDQLARQRDELARLRERYPEIAILHGIEVDVMPDGRLDFPDAVLETLDIVLASMHDSAHQDAQRLTTRCIQAIRHPLVTVFTHPANRIVGRRGDYPLDYEAVYAAAAQAGTALEVDGAPVHLDLDGARARAAVRAGVTLVVDSDAHRARQLGPQMAFGVGTARRGWVEARRVLNTRPLPDVRRFIQAKREGRAAAG
jgi:DNA polymerase (family X)